MEIGADEIRAHVERIVRSKAFETSEVHRHLLQYLAEKTLVGEAERLKEYTVGLEAFGKPPLFVRFPNYGFFRDPRTNDWAEIDQSIVVPRFQTRQ